MNHEENRCDINDASVWISDYARSRGREAAHINKLYRQKHPGQLFYVPQLLPALVPPVIKVYPVATQTTWFIYLKVWAANPFHPVVSLAYLPPSCRHSGPMSRRLRLCHKFISLFAFVIFAFLHSSTGVSERNFKVNRITSFDFCYLYMDDLLFLFLYLVLHLSPLPDKKVCHWV